MIISERIKELRLENNLTQIQLAEAIGVDQSNIARWEKDVQEPKASYVQKLAVFFNVSADYLLGLEEK
jgi:transcriptional regulator with XRE-family HTH domain